MGLWDKVDLSDADGVLSNSAPVDGPKVRLEVVKCLLQEVDYGDEGLDVADLLDSARSIMVFIETGEVPKGPVKGS